MENLNALAEKAKKIIKSVEGNYNNYYVLFSGGKDSLVTSDTVTLGTKRRRRSYYNVLGLTHAHRLNLSHFFALK
jgi:3'-phosphoadenosine 5'-phosphosulfate sulfotransferase (PAPS reductase)/FAD synthetase